jgi:hypothetical protein
MEDLLSLSGANVPGRFQISEAERGCPRFDPLVHFARAGDLDPVDQVGLLVDSRFDARRASPQPTTPGKEILYQ